MKGEPGMTLKTLAKLENALGFRMDEGFRYRASKSGSSSVVVSKPSIGWDKSDITDRPAFAVIEGWAA